MVYQAVLISQNKLVPVGHVKGVNPFYNESKKGMGKMYNRSKLFNLLSNDRGLLALLGCTILSGIILLVIAITTGIWFL